MASTLKRVKPGEPITARIWNEFVDRINCLFNIRGDGLIRVTQNSAGILLSACIPPQPFFFKLTQDTPIAQGYVTAKPLRWLEASQTYDVLSADDELKIYDRINTLTYGSTAYRGPSNWTKKNFIGRAFWAADRGQWQIQEIEHVAKKINFTLNAALTPGGAQPGGTVTNLWDGLDPTVSIPGAVDLLSSPTGTWKAASGAKGSATWRSDLDNSTKWQYQIDDLDCSAS